MLNKQEGYPVAVVGQVLDLSRSSYYYQAQEPDEQRLREAIEDVIRDFPTYGSRRVAHSGVRIPTQFVRYWAAL